MTTELLWLYCVTPAGHRPPPDTLGIGDAPVHAVEEGGLAIWASPIVKPHGTGLDAIRSHNRVVEAALTETVTPVPLRFGQTAAEAQARAMLVSDEDAWRRRLAAVAGTLEFGVRSLRSAPAAQNVRDPARFTGRQFLEELARREREDSSVMAAVHEAVCGLVREERLVHATRGEASPAVAHLVERASVTDYRDALRRLDAQHPDFRLMTTGPWPPWSFAA
jgi:hypothetical protein